MYVSGRVPHDADSMLGSAPAHTIYLFIFARRQVGTVQEGELFRIETLDWTGGQIGDNDSADDVKNIDLTQVHCLATQLVHLRRRQESSTLPYLLNTSSIILPKCRTGSMPAWFAAHAAGALPERASGVSELVAVKDGTVPYNVYLQHANGGCGVRPRCIT